MSAEGRSAPRPSLADRAARELEHRLVTLEFAPGSLLQEGDLVTLLGIGRTPVREAVQRLAAQGLIRVLPRKGLLVTPAHPDELSRAIEVRRVLERLLVVKAAERATPGQRAELRRLGARLEAPGMTPEQLFQCDRELDETLSAACANPFLVQALEPVHAHCRRAWYLNRDGLDLAQAAGLHVDLARAVAAADGAGAIRALNGIISILETLPARLKARP